MATTGNQESVSKDANIEAANRTEALEQNRTADPNVANSEPQQNEVFLVPRTRKDVENDYIRNVFIVHVIHFTFIACLTACFYVEDISYFVRSNYLAMSCISIVLLVVMFPAIYYLHKDDRLRKTMPINIVIFSAFVFPQGFASAVFTQVLETFLFQAFNIAAAATAGVIVILTRTNLRMSEARVKFSILGLVIVYLAISVAIVVYYMTRTDETTSSTLIVTIIGLMVCVFLGMCLIIGAFLVTADLVQDEEHFDPIDFMYGVTLFHFIILNGPMKIAKALVQYFKKENPEAEQSKSDATTETKQKEIENKKLEQKK